MDKISQDVVQLSQTTLTFGPTDKSKKVVLNEDEEFALIELTQGKFAVIDLEDLPLVRSHSWSYHRRGYAVANHRERDDEKPRSLPLHRYIVGTPDGMVTVPRNGDPLDCRKANLVTGPRNVAYRGHSGRPKTNKVTKYRGVYPRKSANGTYSYMVKIAVNGKLHYVGTFHDDVTAALAYDKTARRLLGRHAVLNFPES